MKAKKMPSGSYRAVAYLGRDDAGKVMQKVFTASDSSTAVALAKSYEAKFKDRVDRSSLWKAMDAYIRAKEPVLSPSTIAEYISRARTLKAHFPNLVKKEMLAVTSSDLQAMIKEMRTPHLPYKQNNHKVVVMSPKTVQNYVRFLSAVYKFKGLQLPPVDLPRKERPEIYVPTKEEIDRLLLEVKDTELHIPVSLAAFGPLRRGEIVALKWPDDFDGNVIHVHRAVVTDRRGRTQMKAPKTFSSDRRLPINQEIVDHIAAQGYVTKLSAGQITDKFSRALRRAGLPHFRFHDLRHFCISFLHSIGVPDAYIMQRSGHSTDATLKRVYRHTIADQSEVQAGRTLSAFSDFL